MQMPPYMRGHDEAVITCVDIVFVYLFRPIHGMGLITVLEELPKPSLKKKKIE